MVLYLRKLRLVIFFSTLKYGTPVLQDRTAGARWLTMPRYSSNKVILGVAVMADGDTDDELDLGNLKNKNKADWFN